MTVLAEAVGYAILSNCDVVYDLPLPPFSGGAVTTPAEIPGWWSSLGPAVPIVDAEGTLIGARRLVLIVDAQQVLIPVRESLDLLAPAAVPERFEGRFIRLIVERHGGGFRYVGAVADVDRVDLDQCWPLPECGLPAPAFLLAIGSGLERRAHALAQHRAVEVLRQAFGLSPEPVN